MFAFNKAKPTLEVSVFMDVKTCHGLCCKKQTSGNITLNVIQSCNPIQNRWITSIISPCKCYHFESKLSFSCWPKKVQQTSLAQYPGMVDCNLICWLIMHCIVNYIYSYTIPVATASPLPPQRKLIGRATYQPSENCSFLRQICKILDLKSVQTICSDHPWHKPEETPFQPFVNKFYWVYYSFGLIRNIWQHHFSLTFTPKAILPDGSCKLRGIRGWKLYLAGKETLTKRSPQDYCLISNNHHSGLVVQTV